MSALGNHCVTALLLFSLCLHEEHYAYASLHVSFTIACLCMSNCWIQTWESEVPGINDTTRRARCRLFCLQTEAIKNKSMIQGSQPCKRCCKVTVEGVCLESSLFCMLGRAYTSSPSMHGVDGFSLLGNLKLRLSLGVVAFQPIKQLLTMTLLRRRQANSVALDPVLRHAERRQQRPLGRNWNSVQNVISPLGNPEYQKVVWPL